jgi:hypothetical protein
MFEHRSPARLELHQGGNTTATHGDDEELEETVGLVSVLPHLAKRQTDDDICRSACLRRATLSQMTSEEGCDSRSLRDLTPFFSSHNFGAPNETIKVST